MGRVARAMEARANRVQPEMNRLRGEAAKVLYEGLQQATQATLYDVTKNPKVTRRMFKSIRPRVLGNNAAGVGYDVSRAPYAPIRLKMKGKSKLYGHNKTMEPAAWIERNKGPQLRKLGIDALKRISD